MNPELYGLPLGILVLGLVECAKLAGLPSKLAPVAAVALGILGGLATQIHAPHPDFLQGVVIGVSIGLVASGIFSGVGALSQSPAPQPAAPAEPPVTS